jgi:hypothetical protein
MHLFKFFIVKQQYDIRMKFVLCLASSLMAKMNEVRHVKFCMDMRKFCVKHIYIGLLIITNVATFRNFEIVWQI